VEPLRIAWGELTAVEVTRDEVIAHAAALAHAYNEPRNASLLGNTTVMTEDDVLDHYAELIEEGGHPFLLFRDGELAGDGDLRAPRGTACEFAFLVASPTAQGKGLGTRFATMIHVGGFRHYGLAKIYASIVPENVASRRVFEKLGYALDASAEARSFADDPVDLVMSIDRETFERVNAAAIALIVA